MNSASLAAVIAFVLVGCKKDGPGDAATPADASAPATPPFVSHHSCDWRSSAGTCTDFAEAVELETHKKMCEGFQGTFASAACPKEKLVGSCEVEKGERKRYYEGEAQLSFTTQQAKENCESPLLKGTFFAP